MFLEKNYGNFVGRLGGWNSFMEMCYCCQKQPNVNNELIKMFTAPTLILLSRAKVLV